MLPTAGVLLSPTGCLAVLVGGIMAIKDHDYERGGAKRTLPLAATSFLLSAAHQRSLRNMYFQPRQSFIWGPALRDMEAEGDRERERGGDRGISTDTLQPYRKKRRARQ